MASSLYVRHIFQIRSFSIFVVGFMLIFFFLSETGIKKRRVRPCRVSLLNLCKKIQYSASIFIYLNFQTLYSCHVLQGFCHEMNIFFKANNKK
jgi:hypothetical protein